MSDSTLLDALIVGAGPAGASLACFLGAQGLKGLMISTAPTSSDTPRAHITNMAALECLRDIGLEDECLKLATKGDCMMHTRWCYSMAGREFARIYSWGNDPKRKGDYESASPCRHVDLPQTLLEPILVRYAGLHGFQCGFGTEYISFQEEGDTILTTLRDKVSQQTYTVRSKFLFGADGARSEIMRHIGLPLSKGPGGGLAINVLVKTDLSHLVKHRQGNLHWIMQPDVEHPEFAWICIARMVKPWDEWMFIMFPSLDAGTDFNPSLEDYGRRVIEFIGDQTPYKILGVSKWYINEIVAETYSKGRVFCLGDAVHRHPPFNGLGSNTCIQDAFNLAWKIAYVLKNRANLSLLNTYSAERQPVGKSVIQRSNDAFREHFQVWTALGIMAPTVAERVAVLDELGADSVAGRNRRKQWQEAITQTAHEFHGLGIEMGQHYRSSAVHEADEPDTAREEIENAVDDAVLDFVPSTYPGRRLPHVWLSKAVPTGLISTIDLAGHSEFTLFTGIGGAAWRAAGAAAAESLGVPIRTYSIGFGQDYEDTYFDWARLRGVEESGCVLVRPDRFVAWRATEIQAGQNEWARQKLVAVLQAILGMS